MANDLFMAVFNEDAPPDVVERAGQLEDGGAHIIASNVMLIHLSSSSSSNDLIRKLVPDFDENEKPTALVVFKLNGSYAGYYNKRLWDWLDDAS